MLKIYRRIHANESTPQNDSTDKTDVSSDFSFEFDENQAVAQHLGRTSAETTHNETNAGAFDIETIIDLFQPESFPQKSLNILHYWESVKETHFELYDLALIVFSVPPTEVQIERDFSCLKHIFTDRRYNLTQKRLESILLIHLNEDLFYKVNKRQIDMLKNEQN